MKYEASDEAYGAGDGTSEYMDEDYAPPPSVGRSPKCKVAKPRQSAAGPGRVMKAGRTARGGGTRPRAAGKMSQDHATAVAVRQLLAEVLQSFL